MTSPASSDAGADQAAEDYITVTIAGQMFGLPILQVQDVFVPEALTKVPLAARDVAGVLNLRGRIVTAIDMRRRLGLGVRDAGAPQMAVGIEHKGESYGLLIDAVGEVLRLTNGSFERNPANLDPRWSAISTGVHRLEERLMVVLDVRRILDTDQAGIAA